MKCRHCGGALKQSGDRYICTECGAAFKRKTQPANAKPAGKSSAARKRRKAAERRKRMIMIAIAAIVVIIAIVLAFTVFKKPAADPAVVAAGVIAEDQRTDTDENDGSNEAEAPIATPTPEPTREPIAPAKAHIRAVGDMMSHKLQLTHAHQPDGSFNYDSQYSMIRDSLMNADFTIGNLECSIAADGKVSSYPRFKAPAEMVRTLRDCGFDLLTIANNHVLDGFYPGYEKTIETVIENGIPFVGGGRTVEEATEPRIFDINGIRFGFLAYTRDTNGNEGSPKSENAKNLVQYLDKADFSADVRKLREAGAEVVVCLPHWGTEGKKSIVREQTDYAKKLIAAGVDVIIGSHPHVVQRIDIVTGKDENGEDKQVLIYWSLGNFISYMANEDVDCGIIADFTVNRDADGKISFSDVGYVPVYVWGSKQYFHVVPSGAYYNDKPSGMPDSTFKRMKESARDIAKIIGEQYKAVEK